MEVDEGVWETSDRENPREWHAKADHFRVISHRDFAACAVPLLVVYERIYRVAVKLITTPIYLHCVFLLAYCFIETFVVFARM